MSLKKVQKELFSKEEEVKHYKTKATEITEKYEKTDRVIKHLENTVKEKDQENDRLETRFEEFEVRIGKLNIEKQELTKEFDIKDAEKLELSEEILTKDRTIEDLNITI